VNCPRSRGWSALARRCRCRSPDYDLIAEFDGRLERVQVKTSVAWHKHRFVVAICTRGGNQSWNGVIKRLDATRCDRLFVHVGDGRRWYIPANALGATPRFCSADRSTPHSRSSPASLSGHGSRR